MKRILWVVTFVLVTSFVLSACGGAQPTAAPTAAQPAAAPTTAPAAAPTTAPTVAAAAPTTAPTAAAAEPTVAPTAAAAAEPTAKPTEVIAKGAKGKITIWHQWTGEYLNAISAAFKDYEASHSGVTIELARPSDVQNSLKVAIPAGEGPDIVGWANDHIGDLALLGYIVPLDDYKIDQAFLKSTYEPAAVAGVVWQDKIWALPESQEGIALVANKALATDEYLPKDPKNFDDLLAKAKAFAEKNPGKYLVCNQGLGAADAYHVAPVFFGFGVPSYVDDQGKVYLNTPEAVKAAQWIKDFSAYAPKEVSADICKAMFLEGKAALFWTGPWNIADIEKAKIDYSILPMGKPFVGIKTLMLTSNAVDRGQADVAVDIIKYFTSAEVQTKIALANKTIPAPTGAMKNADVQKLNTLAGFGAAMALGVPMANTPYASAQWTPVGDAVTAIWQGKQTPQEAMDAAQKAVEAEIAKMK
jgi:arabinogalactan oligomer/maltooligosaccharide transport system substrate-binding protein